MLRQCFLVNGLPFLAFDIFFRASVLRFKPVLAAHALSCVARLIPLAFAAFDIFRFDALVCFLPLKPLPVLGLSFYLH